MVVNVILDLAAWALFCLVAGWVGACAAALWRVVVTRDRAVQPESNLRILNRYIRPGSQFPFAVLRDVSRRLEEMRTAAQYASRFRVVGNRFEPMRKTWYGSLSDPWNAGHHWCNYKGTKYLVYLTHAARDVIAGSNSFKDSIAQVLIGGISAAVGALSHWTAGVATNTYLQLEWAWIKETAKSARKKERGMHITFYDPKIAPPGFLTIHPWMN